MRPSSRGQLDHEVLADYFGPTGPASLPATGATLWLKLEPL